MAAHIKVNGGSADAHLMSVRTMNSVAERLPYAEIEVDNFGNFGAAGYDHFDEVEVYSGKRGSEASVFKGYIENIEANHESRTLKLMCRGYALLLSDGIIDISTFTSKASSWIVDNLRQTHGKDGSGSQVITGANINATTDSITRTIKGQSAWDAIMDLALDLGFDAWVDDAKDLHFVTRAFDDSGVAIDSSSLVFKVEKQAEASRAVNRVIVYGGGSPQVVGRADDFSAQRQLGAVKTHFVFDTSLAAQADVDNRATFELSRYVGVPTKLTITGVGWEAVTAGKLVAVDLPEFGVQTGNYYCMEVEHSTPPSETKLTLYAYTHSLEDVILDIIKQLRKLRQADLSSAISTKIVRFHEGVKVSPRLRVYKRAVGTAFVSDTVDGGSLGYGGTALGRGGAGSETLAYDSGA